jgi:hypothetical protein
MPILDKDAIRKLPQFIPTHMNRMKYESLQNVIATEQPFIPTTKCRMTESLVSVTNACSDGSSLTTNPIGTHTVRPESTFEELQDENRYQSL